MEKINLVKKNYKIEEKLLFLQKVKKPSLLQNYRRKRVGTSYDDLDNEIKKELKLSLFKEQKGICAYCCRKLKFEKASIEHHCERSICNGQNGTEDKRLACKKLLLVCEGKNGKILHCDTKKAELSGKKSKLLPMQLIPTDKNHIKTIRYSSTGKIVSNNLKFDKEINKILNLNTAYLKESRSILYKKIFSLSKDKSPKGYNEIKLAKIIEALMATKNNCYTTDFIGLLDYKLKYISKQK